MAHNLNNARTEWKTLPDEYGTWLYIDSRAVWIVRVYHKEGRDWMVKNGSRQCIRYGLWFPLGTVPSIATVIEYEVDVPQQHERTTP